MLNHKKGHFEFLHVTAFAVDRRVTTRIQLQTILSLNLLIAAIAMLVVAALYQSAVPVKSECIFYYDGRCVYYNEAVEPWEKSANEKKKNAH